MKRSNSHCTWFRVATIQIWCRSFFAFGCTDFGSELSTLDSCVPRIAAGGGCRYTSSSVAHIPTAPSPSATLGALKIALFQIQQQFVPDLGRFSHPIADRQQLLLTLLIDADQHQHTKFHILAPQATVDAVRPHVQVHITCSKRKAILIQSER